jgi:hypothetical protein
VGLNAKNAGGAKKSQRGSPRVIEKFYWSSLISGSVPLFNFRKIPTPDLGNVHPHYFSSKQLFMGLKSFTKNTSGCCGIE